MKRAVFKDFLESEQKIELKTFDRYGNFFILFDECMNALMDLMYLDVNVPNNIESDEYAFHLYIKESYMHAPFAFRSIIALMAKGQYQEALNLCRSTVENLVNCKYLFFNKVHAKKTLEGERFNIQPRWDSVAGKEAYGKIYKLLCKIVHKNFGYGNSQPRINAKLFKEKQCSLLPCFEKYQAEAIVNYVIFLLYGYLNLYSLFYVEIENQNVALLGKLEKILKEDLLQFPHKKAWHSIMQKIANKNN